MSSALSATTRHRLEQPDARAARGLAELTRFDISRYEHKAGGEVKDFDAGDVDGPEGRAAQRARDALRRRRGEAGRSPTPGFEIDDGNRTEVGVVFGSGAGGQQLMIDNFTTLVEKGPNRVAPTFIANALVDSTSGMIAIETGAIGHNIAHRVGLLDRHAQRRRGAPRPSAAATASRSSAARRRRRCSRSPTPGSRTCAAWARRGPASRSRRSRARSMRPATDSSSARAPASLFLEDLELAKARGARIYAEVVGYGSAADGWDMIQPIEGGSGSARAMKMALDRRGVPADELDLINPHGTSTPVGDAGRPRRSGPCSATGQPARGVRWPSRGPSR